MRMRNMTEAIEPNRPAPYPAARLECPAISVIVPIYNEQESVAPLCGALFDVLDGIGRPFEVICINDGSTDRSIEALQEIANHRNELRVVNFRRNYGQTAAMMAGIDYASGGI